MKLVWLNYAEFKAKLNARKLAYGPLKKALRESAEGIVVEARQRAPSDQGDLRKTMAATVDGAWPVMAGKAAAPADYASHMEYGTGCYMNGSMPGKGSHNPRGEYLQDWAMRHGGHEKWGANPGRAVAAVIARRPNGRGPGGLRPRKYWRTALEIMEPKIRQNFKQALTEIQRNWEA